MISFRNLASAIFLVGASLASAQSVDRFDAHCADIVILQNKVVQKNLGISKAQVEKMNVFARRHQTELADLQKRTAGKKVDTKPELFKYFAELKDGVIQQLTPSQLHRLREISLQRVGLIALCDPVVGARLGVSAAQQTKLRQLYDQGFKAYSDVEQAAAKKVLTPYEGKSAKSAAAADALNKEVKAKLQAVQIQIAPRLASIRADFDKRMRSLLTSSQIATYNSLRGTPYKP